MEKNGGGPGARSCRENSDVRVELHVRISEEKMRFSKRAVQNFSIEIFMVAKIIDRRLQVVYELEDLNSTLKDGQFFNEDLTHVGITDRTAYKIIEMKVKRVRRGIREYLVRWLGYSQEFHSWVPAASVENV